MNCHLCNDYTPTKGCVHYQPEQPTIPSLIGIDGNINYYASIGLSVCFKAYGELTYNSWNKQANTINEFIEYIGYNKQRGYAFIVLKNGIEICSKDGQAVQYHICDEFNNEAFYDNYEDALNHKY